MTKPISLNEYRILISKSGKRTRVEKRVTHNAMSLEGQGRDEVVLDLPIPPSANALTQMGNGRRWTSTKYKEWKEEALIAYRQQGSPKIGNHTYKMGYDVVWGQTGCDYDNLTKALNDFLQYAGCIKNDNMLRGYLEGDFVYDSQKAPLGLRLYLKRVTVPA